MAKNKAIKFRRIMITFQDDGEPDLCVLEGWDVVRIEGKRGVVTEELQGRFAEARPAAGEPAVHKAVKSLTKLLHDDVTTKRAK